MVGGEGAGKNNGHHDIYHGSDCHGPLKTTSTERTAALDSSNTNRQIVFLYTFFSLLPQTSESLITYPPERFLSAA